MEYIVSVGLAIFASILLLITLRKHKIWRNSLVGLVIVGITVQLGLMYYLEKPEIKLLGNQVVQIEVKGQYFENGAKAIYHFQDVSKEIKTKGDVDTSKIGTYKVEYEVTHDDKTVIEERIIEVVDTETPKITLSGEKTVIASSIELYQEPGFLAEDNYDGDITENVQIETKQLTETQYKKIYTVIDSSGNVAKDFRVVEIKDIVPPEITLQGKILETICQGGVYTEQGASAVDDLDGDISESIQIMGSVDTSKIGMYDINYTVTDKSGNTATKTRKVEVVEKDEEATGVIYLTFDDGPSTSITPHILDILKEENVKATFFILNYSDSTEYLVKRIVDEGHTIAIHGYSHNYDEIYQSVDSYMQNLSKLREKIKESTGVDTTITRFPGGSSNKVSSYNPGIMTTLTQKVLEEGYHYFDWNVSSGDAGDVSTSEGVYRNVTKGLSHKRSNVVLMHDFSGNKKTLNALRDIIHYGKNNGYTFEKITKSTPMVTHRVNN